MQEICLRIEACIRITTLAQVIAPHGVGLTGIGPPLTRGLAGRRDHGVQQHQFRDRKPITGQRSAECAHRLSDDGYFR